VQRQEDFVVHAGQTLQGEHLATDRQLALQYAELVALTGNTASTSAQRSRIGTMASSGCAAQTTVEPS
jgi:hypothetical protein